MFFFVKNKYCMSQVAKACKAFDQRLFSLPDYKLYKRKTYYIENTIISIWNTTLA